MGKFITSVLTLCLLASPTFSQATSRNAALPVEATADNLQVNSQENSAVFSGNAKVVQGILNLNANTITVFFEEEAKNISSVDALGNVKFTNGTETAEARSANFNVTTQTILFTGNVILRQAQTVLTGNQLTYNITTGRSKMTGNVKTVYKPN
ncbi:lipopolysaccharide transport periplasmic protein LptA [Amylibacter sp. SFDW26]|uniref:LptA/OstA family protein n=1 Tax=Amylibacter sp. SFDW26 TaxID=2652722 RepID=UPI0012621106|nr:LptA/OstA family protein [Amylibacter sp. SFDW26]KAB7614540.1 lipopolysaccharide transport periplasmic protein LptA [Amylibacter sp. SFDW26]